MTSQEQSSERRSAGPSRRFLTASRVTRATRLETPINVGSFYCHASIARGGQGEVFLATGDPHARSRVSVVKTFLTSDDDTLRRAARSIDAELGLIDAAHIAVRPSLACSTPWVADVLAWDMEAPTPWVAHEFRGPNLRMHRTYGAQLPGRTDAQLRSMGADPEPSPDLMLALLSAVRFVHGHGVLHRDLKPDNVLVEWRGNRSRVVLCDFDLARGQGQTTITQFGAGMGTLGYTAPEQYFAMGPVTRASDVYSVAMLIVYLHTGLEPLDVMSGDSFETWGLDPEVGAQLGEHREWVEQAVSFFPERRPALEDLFPGPSRIHR